MSYPQATSRDVEEHQPLLTNIQRMSTQVTPQQSVQPEVSGLTDRLATLQDKLSILKDDLREKEAVWKEYEELKMRLFKMLEDQEAMQGVHCQEYSGNSATLEKQLDALKVRELFFLSFRNNKSHIKDEHHFLFTS